MHRCCKCKIKVESGVYISEKVFECDNCHSERKPKRKRVITKQKKKKFKLSETNKFNRDRPPVFTIPKHHESKYANLGSKKAIAKKFCKNLSKKGTKAEGVIKSLLQRFEILFTYQMPIPNHKNSFYITDFYIHKYKVCLEVDGGYHNDSVQVENDRERDRFLESKKLKVVRITNNQAFRITGGELLQLISI